MDIMVKVMTEVRDVRVRPGEPDTHDQPGWGPEVDCSVWLVRRDKAGKVTDEVEITKFIPPEEHEYIDDIILESLDEHGD